MPDAKITDLGDGGLPQPTDDFVVARGATNNKLAWSSLAAAATEGNIAVTLDGNTAGALALASSGTVTLAGGNNITLSQAGNAITISGANVGGAQTGISGIVGSDATYTSGTVTFSGVGGGITVNSNTGQRIDLSVAAQSVQPETQTFIAGVSASDTLYTSGNVRITGVGGGITVSSNTGQRIDLSVAAQSVQPETQTFIAGISASDTLYTSGNVRFSGSQAVTVRSGTGQLVIIDAPAQSVQPETQTFIAGISASDTLYTSGNVRFTGVGGGITVSTNTGQRVDLSVAAPVAATNLSVGVSTGGNTSGNTGVNTGSRFVIVGSNGITASQGTAAGATTVTLSGITQSVQTQDVLSVGVSTGGNTAGNTGVNTGSRFVIVGSNGITASQGTAAGATTITLSGVTQSVQTNDIPRLGVSTGGNTAGDTTVNSGTRLVFVGTNNITLSQGTAASATTITISGPTTAAQSVQTQGILNVALSNVGNTAGDTGINSGTRYVLAGGNNVTLSGSSAANATTVTISAANQTVQTQGVPNLGVSNVGNTSGDTGVNSGTRFVLAGGNNITLSQSTAANATTVTISAGAGGAGLSAGMSTNGNTSGDTGFASQRLALIGGNNITLSGSTNGGSMSITVSAPNLGAGAMSAGVSTGGNTAGATGITGTQLVLVGSGVMSLSQTTGANGGTVSILAPATSSLSATGAVEISTNGSTISIGVPAIRTLGDYENMGQGEAVLMTNIAGISKTPFYFNMNLPGKITANSFVWKVSHVTNNTLQSFSAHLGIYTAVNSTSMALLGSWSETFVMSSASSVSFTGVRHYAASGIGTHTALSVLTGGDYGIGMMFSAGASQSMNMSLMGGSTANGPLGLIRPGVNQFSTGTSQGAMALWGRGSTTVNALPANVVASELVNQGSGASAQLHPWIYIRS